MKCFGIYSWVEYNSENGTGNVWGQCKKIGSPNLGMGNPRNVPIGNINSFEICNWLEISNLFDILIDWKFEIGSKFEIGLKF